MRVQKKPGVLIHILHIVLKISMDVMEDDDSSLVIDCYDQN